MGAQVTEMQAHSAQLEEELRKLQHANSVMTVELTEGRQHVLSLQREIDEAHKVNKKSMLIVGELIGTKEAERVR